jgi:thiamine-phosphate pyrophosphorylase
MNPSSPNKFDLSVYFVADPSACAGRGVVDVIRAAVVGGATLVQLRDKSRSFRYARDIRDFLNEKKIPFIINDDVALAKDIDADGIHVGQGDMNVEEARRLLGPNKIIGVTAFEEAHFASIDLAIVDYAGTGPFYETLTKPGKKVLGPDMFKKLAQISPVPVVGIGGVTPVNAGAVIKAGAAGVAMMRAISEASDPETAARNFARAVKTARMEIAA